MGYFVRILALHVGNAQFVLSINETRPFDDDLNSRAPVHDAGAFLLPICEKPSSVLLISRPSPHSGADFDGHDAGQTPAVMCWGSPASAI